MHVGQLPLVRDAHAGGAVGLGQLDPVGARAHVDRAVAAVPEQLLPLADHAEVAVVHDEDLDRDVLGHAGRELLDVHRDRAVAGDADHAARPGSATFAPIAAGRPKPIVPRPPELIHLRGPSKWKYCAVHIWCWPTSEVTIASPPVTS